MSKNYGYNIVLESSNILYINVTPTCIEVYTLDKGDLSVLILFSNLTYYNTTLTNPSYVLENHTYIYILNTDTSNIIAVATILETGVARYYDSWISNSIYKAYIININGDLYLLIPKAYPKPQTINYKSTGNYVVNATILYYNQQKYYRYNYLWYRYVRDAYFYTNASGTVVSKEYIVNESEIDYFAIDKGLMALNGNDYYAFALSVFHYEEQYYENWSLTNEVWILTNRTLLSTYLDVKPVGFPIYNSVFIVLYDNSGNIYIATTYRHRVVIGNKIPSSWPVLSTSYMLRLGMIDYNVKVTVWRTSI